MRGRLRWRRVLPIAARLALYVAMPGIVLAAALVLAALGGRPSLSAPAAAPRVRETEIPRPTSTSTPTTTPTRTTTPTPAPTGTATPAATATPLPPSGPPTRIVAPAIGLDSAVVEAGYRLTTLGGNPAAEWVVPRDVAGYHEGSAFPGHPGNTVISGHHNVGAEVFRYLVDLEIGDEVILYVGEVQFRYVVTDKLIIREAGVSDEQRRQNARWVGRTEDERLTLVTCWPYSGNSHRVIVVARPAR